MKMLWKGIKNVISMKPGNFDSTKLVSDEKGHRISDPVKIANIFNNYFTNVANSITKKIPRTLKSPSYYLAKYNANSNRENSCSVQLGKRYIVPW